MKRSALLKAILLIAIFSALALRDTQAVIYTINQPINGTQEVPPVVTSGNGTVIGIYDDLTNQLSVTISFSSLTGTTSAGHYHGPALPGANAGVRIAFSNIPLGVTSGSFSPVHTLTASQETELLGGLWYVNIHTSFKPGGEIRGQINPVAPKSLDLTYLIEGLYNGGTNLMVADTVTVNIRNSVSPYTLVESAKIKLNTSGAGILSYSSVSNATPYYIQVLHRNGLETWSAGTVQFVANALSYEFVSAASQAYGSNTTLVGARYCAYSGDVNQDGTIDGTDLSSIDNDASNFVSGYVATDLDGNEFVDGSDAAIADNNAANFVGVAKPN